MLLPLKLGISTLHAQARERVSATKGIPESWDCADTRIGMSYDLRPEGRFTS